MRFFIFLSLLTLCKLAGYAKTEDTQNKNNSALIPVTKLEKDFYDWEERHQQVIEANKKHPVNLIFIGDSITHIFGGIPKSSKTRGAKTWEQYYGHRNAINMGFGWDRTQNVLWRIGNGELEGIAPKVAVILIGTNNLTGTRNSRRNTPEEIAEGIKAICEKVHKKLPDCKILLLSILPRAPRKFVQPIIEINKLIVPLANKDYITYLNVHKEFATSQGLPKKGLILRDGVHPSSQGYAVLAKAIEPTLSKLLKDKEIK